MPTVTKPMPRIGVDKYTFFKLTTDSAAGMKYGTGTTLPGTVEIAPTDAGGTDNFDADNIAYVIEAYTETLGHDITNADIPATVEAEWRGKTAADNGAFIMTGEQKLTYFGVAWRLLKADGTHRYVKYFKGVYSFGAAVGATTKPSTGASDKQTAQATYSATATDYQNADGEGYKYMYIDEADVTTNLIGTGEGKYADLAAFEAAWFSDMAVGTDITIITP